MGGGPPNFIESDNPACFSPHFLSRLLTYSYLCAVDFWLLLNPSRLCFDWSMGSIPLVETVLDGRNAATCGLVMLLGLLSIYGELDCVCFIVVGTMYSSGLMDFGI